MKKILLFVMTGVTMMFMAGCNSLPEHVNLAGDWNYLYSIKDGKIDRTGSMTLKQDGQKLSGVANDAEGQFNLSGKLSGSTIQVTGKCLEKKKQFSMSATLLSESEFKGSYTNSQGEWGKIEGKRK